MGLLDSVRQAAQPQPSPPPGSNVWEYDAEVNKGDMSVKWLPRHLNDRARQGWRLHTVLEQHGNTVFIWERWR